MSDDHNTPKPHNYYDELTPAQLEELAQIEAAAAEVKRIKEIGDAQETFDLNKLSKIKFICGNGDAMPKRFGVKSKSKLRQRRPQIHYHRVRVKAKQRPIVREFRQ